MQTINIEIPIDLINQGETAVLEEIAMQLYQNNIFTFGQARRLLSYSVWDFQKLLGENHSVRQYNQDDLAEDIQEIQSGLWDIESNL